MAVTTYDIAKIANTTQATVSRALRDDPSISIQTKRRIRKLADELGYRPNLLARGLTEGKTYTIGMITTGLDVEVHSVKITTFEEAARNKGYLTITAFNPNEPGLEDKLIIQLLQRSVDGFVIYPAEHGEHKELRALVEKNFPIVTFNGDGRLDFQTNDVSLDYYEGGKIQIEHLSAIGRKRIAYIYPVFSCYTIDQRVSGAKEAAYNAGVDLELIQIDTGSSGQRVQTELAYEKMREFFRENASRFDALACHNDLFALSAIRALHQLGIKVPDDIAVIGFDNISASEFSMLTISTISQPAEQLGLVAFQTLETLVKEKNSRKSEREFIRIKLEPKLIVRESTRRIDD